MATGAPNQHSQAAAEDVNLMDAPHLIASLGVVRLPYPTSFNSFAAVDHPLPDLTSLPTHSCWDAPITGALLWLNLHLPILPN